MANPLSWHKRVPLLVVFIGCVLPLLLAEQRGSAPVSGLRTHERQPQFQDWSTRHALYSRFGTMAALEAARRDPRAQFRWRDQERQTQARFGAFDIPQRSLFVFDMRGGHFGVRPKRLPLRNSPNIHIDWSINLGANGTAPAMYPAKFSFDTTAAPQLYIIILSSFPSTVTGAPPNQISLLSISCTAAPPLQSESVTERPRQTTMEHPHKLCGRMTSKA